MAYRVRRAPARLDRWGQLRGHLGLLLHMTEGNGGLGDLEYLARNPARGVTVHFYAQDNGTIWRMLDLDRISGSLNPGDIAGAREDKGFYGRKHLRAVLGSHYQDPNSYVISMEIGGKAAKGPTPAQVHSIVAWGLDLRRQFPTLRGALGHADCTDTKPCPGTSAAMKAIFAGIGGHGLWATQPTPATGANPMGLVITDPEPKTVDIAAGKQLFDLNGKPLIKVSVTQPDRYSPFESGAYRAVEVLTGGQDQLALVKTADVSDVRPYGPAPASADCSDLQTKIDAAIAALG